MLKNYGERRAEYEERAELARQRAEEAALQHDEMLEQACERVVRVFCARTPVYLRTRM